MSELISNRWRTPDSTIIESKFRWDFVCHLDKNGKQYCVDGGRDYIKVLGDKQDLVDLCVYSDSEHKEKREGVSWGSYGKNGDEELHHILLKDMTTLHIENVLLTQKHIEGWLKQAFEDELQFRKHMHDLDNW